MNRALILVAILSLSILGSGQDLIISQITSAISENSEEKLRKYFDSSVEITTPGSHGVYSENQAVQVMKTFFREHRCLSFNLSHTGNSAGGSKFVVGEYRSSKGEFRVSIFLKKTGADYFIQEMTFEE